MNEPLAFTCKRCGGTRIIYKTAITCRNDDIPTTQGKACSVRPGNSGRTAICIGRCCTRITCRHQNTAAIRCDLPTVIYVSPCHQDQVTAVARCISNRHVRQPGDIVVSLQNNITTRIKNCLNRGCCYT